MHYIKWMILLMSLLPLGCTSAADGDKLQRLSPNDFETSLRTNKSALLLDVRTPGEFQRGHITGAQLMDFYSTSFSEQIQDLPKDKTIYIYCQSSNRSMQAVQMLQKAGYSNIVELRGGMGAWYAAGKK
jgi:rhodanese-related sulfurtransferase